MNLNPTLKWLKRCRVEATPLDGVRGILARHRGAAVSARDAFTLIEMILAIGIAAIVLIVVNVALFTALHLRDATADMVDAESPVDSTYRF